MDVTSYRTAYAILGLSFCIVALTFGFLYYSSLTKERASSDYYALVGDDLETVFPTLDGGVFDFKDHRGEPLMLVFWASWCPSCHDMLALVSKVQKEDSVAIPIVAVNRMEAKDVIAAYRVHYPLPDTVTVVLDEKDVLFGRVGGFSMPTFVLYGKDGTIRSLRHGTVTEDELRAWFTGERQNAP